MSTRRGIGWIAAGAALLVLGALFVIAGLLAVVRGDYTGVQIVGLLAGLCAFGVGAWMLGKVNRAARAPRG